MQIFGAKRQVKPAVKRSERGFWKPALGASVLAVTAGVERKDTNVRLHCKKRLVTAMLFSEVISCTVKQHSVMCRRATARAEVAKR